MSAKTDNGECICDPCDGAKKDAKEEPFMKSVGDDPRFQQQNQTLRCFVSYRDFHRCEHILGQEHKACTWFKDVYEELCPMAWIEKWDDQRSKGTFPCALKDRKINQ